MTHQRRGDRNDDDVSERGDSKCQQQPLQHRRVKRTLEDINDQARRHSQDEQVDESLDRVFGDDLQLPERRSRADQHEEDRHLLRNRKEIVHHPTSVLKSRSACSFDSNWMQCQPARRAPSQFASASSTKQSSSAGSPIRSPRRS